MTQLQTQLTLEEFLALPEGDIIYELINGEALPKMSPKRFQDLRKCHNQWLVRDAISFIATFKCNCSVTHPTEKICQLHKSYSSQVRLTSIIKTSAQGKFSFN
ncbi:hypothetical protein NIES4101_52900 [Calothrix sp. NIES-4101]|nr:hypothetical protein NIES4101_52900 [Calothrix sp. NIES-4101]